MKNQNNFYVYVHKRNDTNQIFYVGKGRWGRAYQKRYRNKEWNKIANSVGFTNEFAQKNMSEEEAFKLEKELIASIGIENLTNIMLGGDGGKSRDKFDLHYELAIWKDMLDNFDYYYKSKWFREMIKIFSYTQQLAKY